MGKVLKLMIALGALGALAVVAFFVSPLGRSLLHGAMAMVKAASSPAARAMQQQGCQTAIVANLHEAFGPVQEALGRASPNDPGLTDLITVLCRVEETAANQPTCDALAAAYGKLDEAPPKFLVEVVRGRSDRQCAGLYDRSGRQVPDTLPQAPPPR